MEIWCEPVGKKIGAMLHLFKKFTGAAAVYAKTQKSQGAFTVATMMFNMRMLKLTKHTKAADAFKLTYIIVTISLNFRLKQKVPYFPLRVAVVMRLT